VAAAPLPVDLSFFLISLLNGLSVGLLLFMLASGLTLIFSMMGVLNFAHASFYMLGAYVAYTVTVVSGSFWLALVLAPLVVGLMGAAFERFVLRRVHRFGHGPELLITFGLSYIVLELVQLVWGRTALDFQPPPSLRVPLFTIVELPGHLSVAAGLPPDVCRTVAGAVCTTFPAFRAFGMGVAVLMLVAVWLLLTRTRIGLVIQAALTHPEMTESLGHNVPRVFMLVFGGGTALAGLAGVIGGALRVTEPGMALTVGAVVFAVIVIGGMGSLAGLAGMIGGNAFVTEPGMAATVGSVIFVVVVVGGMGSLAGAFLASLLIGVVQTFAVAIDASIMSALQVFGMMVTSATPGYALWKLKISQVAPILPYLFLVLVLIFRPRGLMGTREG
jgi:branched-chain amino acid transport system permease protein